MLLVTASTGCSGGEGTTARPSATQAAAPTAAPTPSPPDLTEVINRTRATLMTSGAVGPDAPGSQGLMMVEAWPAGAAYAWETSDRRLCWASVGETGFSERACATDPMAIGNSRGVAPLATLFTDGWVRLFAADHQQVTSATCGGEPLEVRRVGTVADEARTLYAVWFPDYTKGSITLLLRHDDTTSKAPLQLGDAGDRTCAPSQASPAAPARNRTKPVQTRAGPANSGFSICPAPGCAGSPAQPRVLYLLWRVPILSPAQTRPDQEARVHVPR